MCATRARHSINTSPDNERIEVEDGGVYRIIKPSLTGVGTHTKWFYPGETDSWRGEERDRMDTASDEERRRVVSFADPPSFDSSIDGTLSTVLSREPTPELAEVVNTDGENLDNFETLTDSSDATEIIDEDLENTRFWSVNMSKSEEPLPDLPYERIMMRISQEPTLILEDGI